MGNINLAYRWMIDACNADNIGYSQTYRKGQTVNGKTYFDCSSMISKSLTVGEFYEKNPWFTTHNMRGELIELGFVKLPIDSEWLAGDILWREGHTEMVYQGRRTMGAHSSKYAFKDQVSINDNESSPSDWTELYRYGNGALYDFEWIKGNYYLSESEMRNNAYGVYSILSMFGWSVNAIAGVLGNMEQESTINPALWQGLQANPNLGYGLVQWTPSTNYTSWANSHGYDITDGFFQLLWLESETVSSGQWIPTSDYNISFEEFKTSKKSVDYLTSAFLKNFERAGVELEGVRRANAKKWYAYIKDLTPWLPTSQTKQGMPIWMMV